MTTPDYFTRSPSTRSRPNPSSRLPSGQGPGTPGSPHTPLFGRSISSQFGSPGSFRVEEEFVIYEFGSRYLRAGFAGESAPRCIIQFSPEESRRAGDFESWLPARAEGSQRDDGLWAANWELWRNDLRGLDLGLVEDKLERVVRKVHTRYFLLDIKSRKAIAVFPPCLPRPLVEICLRVLFTGVHQPPSVVPLSSPMLNTVAAGLRSALVVDVGWYETTVTAVFEYREVLQKRTDRAAKMLSCKTLKMLRLSAEKEAATVRNQGISFAVVEDVMIRALWCRFGAQDNSQADTSTDDHTHSESVRVSHTKTLEVPFSQLAQPAESTFFDVGNSEKSLDDHHLPLHLLAWKCLLALPFDVRSTCVSRIIVTGGPSHMPGLKSRLIQEIEHLITTRGWDPVMNYGSAPITKDKCSTRRNTSIPVRLKPPELPNDAQNLPTGPAETVGVPTSQLAQENDEILERITRNASKSREVPVPNKNVARGVESLGAWTGASLMASMRAEGSVEIKKDDFLKYGMAQVSNFV